MVHGIFSLHLLIINDPHIFETYLCMNIQFSLKTLTAVYKVYSVSHVIQKSEEAMMLVIFIKKHLSTKYLNP